MNIYIAYAVSIGKHKRFCSNKLCYLFYSSACLSIYTRIQQMYSPIFIDIAVVQSGFSRFKVDCQTTGTEMVIKKIILDYFTFKARRAGGVCDVPDLAAGCP